MPGSAHVDTVSHEKEYGRDMVVGRGVKTRVGVNNSHHTNDIYLLFFCSFSGDFFEHADATDLGRRFLE